MNKHDRQHIYSRLMQYICKLPNGCWQYTGGIDKTGYGRFRVEKVMAAHRTMWWLIKEEDPGQATILHKCGNRQCCNIEHLEKKGQIEHSKFTPFPQ